MSNENKTGGMISKEKVLEIRNALYDKMPAGKTDAFDLLRIIKEHLGLLDEAIDSSLPLPSAEQQGEKHFEYLADTQKAKAENPKPVFTFNEREQQGWISVKDGLPKDDDFVLFVHFHAGWQAIIEEYAGKFSEVKYFRKHQLENSYTHWRLLPLPSPPVEEKDTKK